MALTPKDLEVLTPEDNALLDRAEEFIDAQLRQKRSRNMTSVTVDPPPNFPDRLRADLTIRYCGGGGWAEMTWHTEQRESYIQFNKYSSSNSYYDR